MKRLLAVIASAVMCLSFASCGSLGDMTMTGKSGVTGFNAVLSGNTVTGTGYTLNVDRDKWISADEYMKQLSDMGYEFDKSNAEELKNNADGVLYFIDESIKQGMEKEYFTYDVPHLVISAPDRSKGYENITISDMAEDCLNGLEDLYKTMDGIDLVREESGLTDIGGRTYLKVAMSYSYADGEIKMKRIMYQCIEQSVMYTLTFSSTEELSDRMEDEYEAIVKTLSFI